MIDFDGGYAHLTRHVHAAIRMRERMESAQQQLATGDRAVHFGQSQQYLHWTVSMRRQVSDINGQKAAIDATQLRLQLLDTSFTSLDKVVQEIRKTTLGMRDGAPVEGRNAIARQMAELSRDLISIYNQQTGGRHVFGGRQTGAAPVAVFEHLRDGAGGRSGFAAVRSERFAADLGEAKDFRIAVAADGGAGLTVQKKEEQTEFGLEPKSATSTSEAVAIVPPTGSRKHLAISLQEVPPAGTQIVVTFGLPDGSEVAARMVATDTPGGGSGEFQTVAGNIMATRDHLLRALQQEIEEIGAAELPAASAMRAASMFFFVHPDSAPQRVDIPATGDPLQLRTGESDTLHWYTGDRSDRPPRQDITAKLDSNVEVHFGLRANEPPLGKLLAASVAFATMEGADGDRSGTARLQQAMLQRLEHATAAELQRDYRAIHAELAAGQSSLHAAHARLELRSSIAKETLQSAEKVDMDQAAMELARSNHNLKAMYSVLRTLADASLAMQWR